MTDATQLAREYLEHDRIAWSARAEHIVLASFDRLEAIRAQVRSMGQEAMDAFDSIVMPHGFKSIARMIG